MYTGLDRAARRVVAVVFAVTGAAALLTQITWQRVIALHSGVDLVSSAIVVAAFLGGLGLGNLAGGPLADRCRPERALRVLGLANLGVAAYSAISIYLLYDLYRELAAGLEALPLRLLFNAVVLLVPTLKRPMSEPARSTSVATARASSGSDKPCRKSTLSCGPTATRCRTSSGCT